MKNVYDIIRRPIITEKSSNLVDKLVYTFEVSKDANKVEIKEAIEKIFEVEVESVNTVSVHRKAARMQRYEGFKPAYKKAIVTLKPGFSIKAFEI